MNADGHAPRLLGGRYEVGPLLGRGGMASVHLGRDTRLGRQVAIKMLRSDLARDPSFHARFKREAQAAAALNHPAIVAVYDTGEDVQLAAGGMEERTPYIVMEYVHGRTLRDILRSSERQPAGGVSAGPDEADRIEGQVADAGAAVHPVDTGGVAITRPLDVDEAVKYTAGVLAALDYSHRHGIVHRDIKPGNVMVTDAGQVKVMDFGIARAVADSSATMTQTHAVIGTAQYLSPEQARGETVDARSDLYSAGCLLYELLTGRPPFVGDSPVSVAYQHVRETPQPPSVHNPAVPQSLDRVVLMALAKDREDRYATAEAFRRDLVSAAAGRAVSAPPLAAAAAAAAAAPTEALATQALPAEALPTEALSTEALATEALATEALPAQDRTTGQTQFLARTAQPGETVTIGRVEDDEPHRGRRAAGYVLLVLAVLAVLALVAFGVSRLLEGRSVTPQVAVPKVVGLDRAGAKSTIEGARLKYAEGTPENNDAAAGTVIDQSPEPAIQVDEGATVTVVLSLGPAEVTVPDLRGMTEDAARSTLQQYGLSLGAVKKQDDPQAPRDTVIDSSPKTGLSVAKGTKVDIVISTGQVELPDLVGMTTQEARRALLERGLEIKVDYQDSDKTPDTVIEQDPKAGKVPQGTTVRVIAAQAPPPSASPTETTPSSPTDTPTDTPTGTMTDSGSIIPPINPTG